MEIANRHNLLVIEDAAQGVMSTYRGKALGSIGHLGALSFHETKNIISGEGGALLINDPSLVTRAEIIREKGTNRSQFFRGQVDKYTWVDIGSSFLPGEIVAAFLWAQMQEANEITNKRMEIWNTYHFAFYELEAKGRVRRPHVPLECEHNAHMYYLILNDLEDRTKFIQAMKHLEVNCVFHYVPLHTSTQGLACARSSGELQITSDLANRLVRLPLWVGLMPEMSSLLPKFLNQLR
jgi:dTDP-4-amino-4,6-dideoxygalactose transaminase